MITFLTSHSYSENTVVPYADIINLVHPTPRRPMPMAKRASQFAPFAALSGYEEAIAEVTHAYATDSPRNHTSSMF